MAEQIIKTKIALRYNDYAYWTNETLGEGKGAFYKPLKGEVCFCAIETKDQGAQTAPTVLFKVGNGTDTFKTLKWASALAADVYGWAKQTENDFVNTFLALKMNDGTTMQAKLDGVFATDAELAQAIADLRKEIPAKLGVMSVKGKEAIKATGEENVEVSLALDNSGNVALSQSDNGLKANIDLGDYALKSELHAPTTVAAGAGINVDGEDRNYTVSHANTSDVANVTKEARKYVAGVTFDDFGHVTAVEMGEEVDQDLTHDHDAQYKKLQTAYTKELTGAQVVAKVEQNANGDVTVIERTLTAADLGLDTVMHFIGAYAAAPEKAFAGTGNERDLANGDVYLNTANATEYVYSNSKWVELGNEEGAGSHALKTISITGTGYLTGGGTLEANRTIDISDEAKAKIDKAHSHANKNELDSIADGDVAKWTEAYNKRHEHSNKELLDTYTQTEENLADAVAKKHAHGNKELLDTYDQTNENIKAAINAKHEHANKNELDLFVAGDKAKLDSALQGIEADTGLKVVEGTVNKIAIDTDVVFVLDCNW